MSSVRSVSVSESRETCALSVEICDCVCEASVVSEGAGCWGFSGADGVGRWAFRKSTGEKVEERKGLRIESVR